MKFINKQNRGILSEGRNHGMGFAFCKCDGETVETIMPISPCKDYLNDVVYSERSGQDSLNHGLKTTKLGLFEDKQSAYMVASICGRGAKKPAAYAGMDGDIELLNNNFKNIEKAINWMEDRLKLEPTTGTFDVLVIEHAERPSEN